MSMLVCPLCGKSTSLAKFNPSDFDDDIVVQTIHGLGRGRGFEVVSRESALGNSDVTSLVAERVLMIVYHVCTLSYTLFVLLRASSQSLRAHPDIKASSDPEDRHRPVQLVRFLPEASLWKQAVLLQTVA
jgi:hypothetical protein